jgi:hypothetical protein
MQDESIGISGMGKDCRRKQCRRWRYERDKVKGERW